MNENPIKAIIFDLDGTLYSLALRRLRMSLLWRDLRMLRHLNGVRRWLRTRSFSDAEELHDGFCEELARRAGVSRQEAHVWYNDRFFESFIKMLAGPARLRPGLIELLTRLRCKGVKLAVVSDFGFVRERLDALGIPVDVFDDVRSAEDFGELKPSPKALTALAGKWNIEPGSVAVVGDRFDLDGICAQAAGMRFVGICEKFRSRSNGSEFFSWAEAVKILEARAG